MIDNAGTTAATAIFQKSPSQAIFALKLQHTGMLYNVHITHIVISKIFLILSLTNMEQITRLFHILLITLFT